MVEDQTALDATEEEEAEEPALTLTVEVEELENWKRKLTVEISQEDVKQRYEDRLGELSSEARIVQDYETNNVGIWLRVPTKEKAGFRLKLIDHPDDDWPPVRQQ